MPTKTRLPEASVVKATGKGWDHWFSVLDKFDCAKKGHKESAAHLLAKHKVGAWWSQTITVEYEVAKGLRKPNQRSGGKFGTDAQRTVAATVDACWDAFTTARGLNTWFASKAKVDLKVGGTYTGAGGDKCTFKNITPKKRLVMTWEHPKHSPGSQVEVTFTPTHGGRTTVRVSHTKIASKKEADDLKKAWGSVMDEFREAVEA